MKVIFLDRDGVVNKYPGENEYVKSWREFRFLPRAKNGLKKLSDSGFKIFIVSNQSGIGKGIYSQKALDLITRNMLRGLRAQGIRIAGVYYCTHTAEDNCSCRKPKSGLIDMALSGLKPKLRTGELAHSFFIGDSLVDIQTGKSAGLRTILVFSGKQKPRTAKKLPLAPDYTAKDLYDAAGLALKNQA